MVPGVFCIYDSWLRQRSAALLHSVNDALTAMNSRGAQEASMWGSGIWSVSFTAGTCLVSTRAPSMGSSGGASARARPVPADTREAQMPYGAE